MPEETACSRGVVYTEVNAMHFTMLFQNRLDVMDIFIIFVASIISN